MLGTLPDLLLVILGFGLIIFVHELGHFLAARWAGIRVLAFAIGFGPALFSYRKGLGFRKGSSEREYHARLSALASSTPTAEDVKVTHHALSPTEYRLNYLPFGGYVKMLGQDDMDATARSSESDSYQSCVPWKRLVVISAGVVMNIITAAILFVIVFMAGRQVSPPIIGAVEPGSPAALATPIAPLSNTDVGLRPGDNVLRVGGKTPTSFDDLTLAVAMAHRERPLEFVIERNGRELTFQATPRKEEFTGLLGMGAAPAFDPALPSAASPEQSAALAQVFAQQGLPGLLPGDVVTHAAGAPVRYAHEVDAAFAAAAGEDVTLTVRAADGVTREVKLPPAVQFEEDMVLTDARSATPVRHLLGLTGVLRIEDADPKDSTLKAADQGLKDGDIFASLGSVEYPSTMDGIREIKAHKGKTIDAVVLRRGADGAWTEVSLPGLKVAREGGGRLGFSAGNTSDSLTLLARPIERVERAFDTDVVTAASGSALTAGSTILEVAGMPTANLAQVRNALRMATATQAREKSGATVTLTIQRPVAGVPDARAPREPVDWKLSANDIATLHALSWSSPLSGIGLLPTSMVELRADNPIEAVRMGIAETKRVMLMTYMTFARLAQGSVKIEHLKGPVGIAHLGTLVADRGLIWLLFFLALISVNLAVINFLPLPIVDGGQFLFILYEWIRGKPVPVGFQNAVTMAGLVMIGVMFLFVTYNDIRGLLGL